MLCKSQYKDIHAVKLEDGQLSVRALPGHGGKLASILYKPLGKELLFQSPGGRYLPPVYGGRYVDAECSGFDDMLPTIDRFHYPHDPWRGVEAPDHGEVFSLPWSWDGSEDRLVMRVYGVRFPYRFTKTLELPSPGCLRIEYLLENLSPFDFSFLWAGHIMLDGNGGGEILLPFDRERAVCMFSSDSNRLRYGEPLNWPVHRFPDGREQDLSRVCPGAGDQVVCKYYFPERLREGRCAYRYGDGVELRLSFPEAAVPYLGLLHGESPRSGDYQVFLEPCTAPYDRPDLAELRGSGSVLKAGGSHRWHLEFEISKWK